MIELPQSLLAMGKYPQFILYKLVPHRTIPGKMDKLPIDYRTCQVYAKGADWQQDPTATTTFEIASTLAAQCGPNYGIGFFFKKEDPLFFLDIDNCLQGDQWSPTAIDIINKLPGAAVEVSQSGTGLHIFGSYSAAPDHSCKNTQLDLELYTSGRFVALTGDRVVGDVATDCTQTLASVVAQYYPPKQHQNNGNMSEDWTTEAVPEYTGPEDDAELIKRALNTKSASSAFGGSSSFKDLWEANEEVLGKSYPDAGGRPYDASSADQALAQHLAFWTGNNCERILKIMKESKLCRDKWEREDYLPRTILNSVSMQTQVYSITPTVLPEEAEGIKLNGTKPQIKYGLSILADKIIECKGNQDHINLLLEKKDAKYWIDKKNTPVDEIIISLIPIETTPDPFKSIKSPEFSAGYQYLGPTQQAEHFKGCVYIQENHRIFTPTGALLKAEQFNATYGGYNFDFSSDGKITKKAFEAFTESQMVKYPKAEIMCFKPNLEPGKITKQDGRMMVNTYVPVVTKRIKGDITPFLNHLKKVLPIKRDQTILLSYMAACVQHKGIKFQWAPLLQGTHGNGKTLFTLCVAAAIGKTHTHLPRAAEIGEKFNAWLFNKIFIGVEDIKVHDQKRDIYEILKPMITSESLERRAMQSDQVMHDICCNFIFNSNYRDALPITDEDRRFCIFFTAQQNKEDLIRDGMIGDYFPNLYDWLKADGYAIVTDFLYSYEAPEEFNIRAMQSRAPITSTTADAVKASLGGVEQEIIEAIDEGRPGFANGWISSMALNLLLISKRKDSVIPINKRKDILETLGYKYHPGLKNGRVNNAVMPDNGKPRLFVKDNNPANCLTVGKEIAAAYSAAQEPNQSRAAEVFGKN